jgi:hypothetical protein
MRASPSASRAVTATAGSRTPVARCAEAREGAPAFAGSTSPPLRYGFASWPRLEREVERREILDTRDLDRLRSLLASQPELARTKMEHWCDHKLGAEPLGYIAMLRFDAGRLGLPHELSGTGAVALLDAGAPVDGSPGAIRRLR